MINTQNIDTAKKLIKKSSAHIIVKAQSLEFNRKILEYGKFQILLSPESTHNPRDSLRKLDTSFNHITAKIAAKNNISIAFDLNLRNKDKKEKAILLSRIIQIIKFCRKAKTQIAFLNSKDKIDACNLLISLGSSTNQISKCF